MVDEVLLEREDSRVLSRSDIEVSCCKTRANASSEDEEAMDTWSYGCREVEIRNDRIATI